MPSAEDLRLLQRFRAAHAPALVVVEDELDALGLTATSRTKTPGTIVDKLRRETTRLTSIQDVAGTRVVPDVTLTGQDEIVEAIRARLGGNVHDRRADPSHGYRAVHLVVRVEGRRVEIQVRTPLQHLWAEVMERVADRFGRDIRYGSLPSDPKRRAAVEQLIGLSSVIAAHEELRTSVVRVQGEIDAAVILPPDLSPEDLGALQAHAQLKVDLHDDEISFRGALRVIVDALEEGEAL